MNTVNRYSPLGQQALLTHYPGPEKFVSLGHKLLLGIALWVVCILSFVSITVSITWRLEDRGVEINQLGQLNKQIFRLVATAAAVRPDTESMTTQMAAVEQSWQAFLKQQDGTSAFTEPTRQIDTQLQTMLRSIRHGGTSDLMPQADALADNISRYTRDIEAANTRSITLLRVIRLCLIGLIFGSALLCYFLLRRVVLQPLATLSQGMRHVGSGHFATRVQMQGSDEFAQAAVGFNQMAAHLEDVYTHMEDKVRAKTEQVHQQEYQWRILYQTTAYLHQSAFGAQTIRRFLQQLQTVSGAIGAAVYLPQGHGAQSESLNMAVPTLGQWRCLYTDCQNHSQQKYTCYVDEQGRLTSQPATVILIPVWYQNQLCGLVALQTASPFAPTRIQQQVWRLLCTQLAIAGQNASRSVREQQLAVLEERNLMAQGLHDSIAQSLSFLKIQFQLLHKYPALSNDSRLRQNLSLIQNGLDCCYEDVRELLHNFRTRIDLHGFTEAVEHVVLRHRQQTNVPLSLHMDRVEPSLNEVQQIQILFILQEALSNIRKHAAATEAKIVIEDSEDFGLNIEDNGCGFDYPYFLQGNTHTEHFGLNIMQERAKKIRAHFAIGSMPGKGTRIQLLLPSTER